MSTQPLKYSGTPGRRRNVFALLCILFRLQRLQKSVPPPTLILPGDFRRELPFTDSVREQEGSLLLHLRSPDPEGSSSLLFCSPGYNVTLRTFLIHVW